MVKRSWEICLLLIALLMLIFDSSAHNELRRRVAYVDREICSFLPDTVTARREGLRAQTIQEARGAKNRLNRDPGQVQRVRAIAARLTSGRSLSSEMMRRLALGKPM